jgi:amidase
MDAADLAFAGPARQAELVRSREVSPRELVELSLHRIERIDPDLNAFRVVLAERALLEADQAGARAGAGDDRPLLGVPVAVKDDLGVAGVVRTMGTNAAGDAEPADYEAVARLRAAGAIVVGITNVPELVQWGFTETPTNGITRNPWDRQRTPGGSSGGSGAAVAAGLVPFATASDGAGSIRIPAALNGLVGLKPQRGRVPTAPLVDPWRGLSVFGALTRTVADCALVYEVLARRPYVAAAQQDPGRLRIAVSTKVPPGVLAKVDPEVLQGSSGPLSCCVPSARGRRARPRLRGDVHPRRRALPARHRRRRGGHAAPRAPRAAHAHHGPPRAERRRARSGVGAAHRARRRRAAQRAVRRRRRAPHPGRARSRRRRSGATRARARCGP